MKTLAPLLLLLAVALLFSGCASLAERARKDIGEFQKLMDEIGAEEYRRTGNYSSTGYKRTQNADGTVTSEINHNNPLIPELYFRGRRPLNPPNTD
jgi:hypothetical protein